MSGALYQMPGAPAPLPEPPDHLSDTSKLLWARIIQECAIDGAAYPILVMLCEARDRRDEARLKIIESGGAVVKDRFGQLKRNAWVDVEDKNGQLLTRAYTALGLNLAPPSQGKLDF